MSRIGGLFLVALAVLALGAGPRVAPGHEAAGRTEVVVSLTSPPLATGGGASRVEAEQRAFRAALSERLPDARVRWRYRLVANGFAVVLPRSEIVRLRELPGVREVYESAQYGPQLDGSPAQIGAPAVWGPGLATAGQGTKIGIIDSGIDQRHAFFGPAGYSMPAGFPKGQRQYTTAKVIVARAFPPPGATSNTARLPVDTHGHGTHVAGIAAGNASTRAPGERIVSGVAPRAYLGNYKVFVPTESGLSPNANAPEITAAIEAAVADGMDVINFSGGEPEIEPSRDLVALALDAAAAAGVVPVVAAGNDYNDVGAGSVSSPANSAKAITVAAVETEGVPGTSIHADFSSVGPTTISLRQKPDVAAPGVGILSSVPGGWASVSGTSMASPHVAGAAALLQQRHPEWTVAEIKSALVQTGTDAEAEDGDAPVGPAFVGGGVVALTAADRPLLFAAPTGLSFGLLSRSSAAASTIGLEDAGGGAGTWQVTLTRPAAPAGTSVVVPEAVEVPGELSWQVVTSASAAQGEVSGYIVLHRGADERRVPFWGRVSVPALAQHRPGRALVGQGVHRATTEGRPELVSRYRYPEDPEGLGVTTVLRGPELVYLAGMGQGIVNFGVVVTQRAPGSRVEPRVVAGLDENRLTGYAGLPVAHNPYLESFREPVLAAGALSPAPGLYAIVFDSATSAGAGRFTFRFWVNDVTPPTVRLRTKVVRRGRPIVLAVSDAGAGVYPESIRAAIDGRLVRATYRRGVVRIATTGFTARKLRLRLRVSDYQEAKNTESVARILPNTRVLTATVTITGP